MLTGAQVSQFGSKAYARITERTGDTQVQIQVHHIPPSLFTSCRVGVRTVPYYGYGHTINGQVMGMVHLSTVRPVMSAKGRCRPAVTVQFFSLVAFFCRQLPPCFTSRKSHPRRHQLEHGIGRPLLIQSYPLDPYRMENIYDNN